MLGARLWRFPDPWRSRILPFCAPPIHEVASTVKKRPNDYSVLVDSIQKAIVVNE